MVFVIKDFTGERIGSEQFKSLHFEVLVMLLSLGVAGGLLVKALDCGLKDSGFPLAAEIYFSSGRTQPYPKNWVGFPCILWRRR